MGCNQSRLLTPYFEVASQISLQNYIKRIRINTHKFVRPFCNAPIIKKLKWSYLSLKFLQGSAKLPYYDKPTGLVPPMIVRVRRHLLPRSVFLFVVHFAAADCCCQIANRCQGSQQRKCPMICLRHELESHEDSTLQEPRGRMGIVRLELLEAARAVEISLNERPNDNALSYRGSVAFWSVVYSLCQQGWREPDTASFEVMGRVGRAEDLR